MPLVTVRECRFFHRPVSKRFHPEKYVNLRKQILGSTLGCRSSQAPCMPLRTERSSQPLQACVGIAELLELHSHPIHDREVQAAQFPIVVASLQVVQRASCFQGATQPSG